MNIFRLIGDLLHLLSFFLLIQKILKKKSCQELSYRTQEIFLIVFCTRYLDLFMYFVSLYNTLMKVGYIGCTSYIIYLMRFKKPYCTSYSKEKDNFNHRLFLYPAVMVITIIFHSTSEYHQIFELLWSFSIWLEAVAIVPQIYIVYRLKEVEMITGNYMASLGLYRFFYILNWIYRYFFDPDEPLSWVSFIGGIIQTAVYMDFLYYYFKRI